MTNFAACDYHNSFNSSLSSKTTVARLYYLLNATQQNFISTSGTKQGVTVHT